jgi:hypothetical protein
MILAVSSGAKEGEPLCTKLNLQSYSRRLSATNFAREKAITFSMVLQLRYLLVFGLRPAMSFLLPSVRSPAAFMYIPVAS